MPTAFLGEKTPKDALLRVIERHEKECAIQRTLPQKSKDRGVGGSSNSGSKNIIKEGQATTLLPLRYFAPPLSGLADFRSYTCKILSQSDSSKLEQ